MTMMYQQIHLEECGAKSDHSMVPWLRSGDIWWMQQKWLFQFRWYRMCIPDTDDKSILILAKHRLVASEWFLRETERVDEDWQALRRLSLVRHFSKLKLLTSLLGRASLSSNQGFVKSWVLNLLKQTDLLFFYPITYIFNFIHSSTYMNDESNDVKCLFLLPFPCVCTYRETWRVT